MIDKDTQAFYNGAAAQYTQMAKAYVSTPQMTAFLAAVPKGGRIHDLGGGPGLQADYMMTQGYEVSASDASPAMVKAAQVRGVKAYLADFDAFDGHRLYDGVWSSFALLHSPRAALPGHLARIFNALKSGGIFMLALKTGTGEARDKLGRFYSYFTDDELRTRLTQAGFTIRESWHGHSKGCTGSHDPFSAYLAQKDAR